MFSEQHVESVAFSVIEHSILEGDFRTGVSGLLAIDDF